MINFPSSSKESMANRENSSICWSVLLMRMISRYKVNHSQTDTCSRRKVLLMMFVSVRMNYIIGRYQFYCVCALFCLSLSLSLLLHLQSRNHFERISHFVRRTAYGGTHISFSSSLHLLACNFSKTNSRYYLL